MDLDIRVDNKDHFLYTYTLFLGGQYYVPAVINYINHGSGGWASFVFEFLQGRES